MFSRRHTNQNYHQLQYYRSAHAVVAGLLA
jgi:hypothetical protein